MKKEYDDLKGSIRIVAAIGFLVLMLLPGTAGPNRFGPDPKDPNSAEVFA